MSELPEYIQCLLRDIAKAECFTDHVIESQAGSNHGDNFCGVLIGVAIRGKRLLADGTFAADELHLLCKVVPSNAARRKEFQSIALFKRETDAYLKFLPLFAEFQREKGLTADECFISYPKVYAAVCDEQKDQFVLIMEDMRPQRYVMWPKAKPIPTNIAYAVIEQLAKFHAVSFALKDQRPEAYNQFRGVDDLVRKILESNNLFKAVQLSFDRAIGVLENSEHAKILEQIRDNALQCVDDCMSDGVSEPFSVLGHGDCWINNFLFRYDEHKCNELESLCFVDWQLVRFCSPALDLHYMLFTATDKEFRDKEYDNLIAFYYRTLAGAIRRLGSDPTVLFPEAAFRAHLKKFGKFALLLTPMLIQMMLADPKDVADMDVLSDTDNGDVDFVRGYDEVLQQKYSQRINDLLTDVINYGYHAKTTSI